MPHSSPYSLNSVGTMVTFLKEGSCSGCLLTVLDRSFGHPMMKEEKAAMNFAGGIAQHGFQCGQIWGAVLAAGAEVHRVYGEGPRAEAHAVATAARLVDVFRGDNGSVDCYDLTQINQTSSKWKLVRYFLLQGGTARCMRMAARYAPHARETIRTAVAKPADGPSAGPVSCAALLAARVGATPQQIIMAAGFAGGIGLCGGACGALGAAVWLQSLRTDIPEGQRAEYNTPAVQALIEAFLESSDYQFECRAITGLTFHDAAEHAAFIREGGCARIIDALEGALGRGVG